MYENNYIASWLETDLYLYLKSIRYIKSGTGLKHQGLKTAQEYSASKTPFSSNVNEHLTFLLSKAYTVNCELTHLFQPHANYNLVIKCKILTGIYTNFSSLVASSNT